MSRIAALVLAFVLALPLSAPAKATLLDSVMPLQHDGATFCTAFSINEQDHLWLTARHCAAAVLEGDWAITIGYDWAFPVYLSPGRDDLAVFQSNLPGKALALAGAPAGVLSEVEVWGFPYGLPLTKTHGRVAARNVPVGPTSGISDLLDVTVAPGNSGSPVLQDGKVVGVVWGKFDSSNHAISVPYDVVKRLVGIYFK
jgi:hypothetical protein